MEISMLKERLLHTPEGVRDIYNGECARKLVLQNRIHDVLKLYGYSDISTPTFEFFDVFNKERGSVASNEMFKFFDRDGNTMVLRPDMTPSIARTAAKYYGESDMTLKLCYVGNTFINNHNYQGRLKETTQIGAELIGDSSIYADAEIIAMVIDGLLNSGLKEFQVEIGQVQFFRGLLKEAGIDDDVEGELTDLILNKNFYGVEELLKSQNLDDKLTDTLLVLPQMFGSVEVLDKARAMTHNEEALNAVAYLEELYGLLSDYGYEKYITFDLGMLSRHKYYTGVIFNGYTYGTGDAVVKGGRYDKLIGQFGNDKASIGFSLTVDQLMAALERQKIEIPLDSNGIIVMYQSQDWKTANSLAQDIRKTGTNVNMLCGKTIEDSECTAFAKSSNVSHIIQIMDADNVKIMDVKSENVTTSSLKSVLAMNF